MRTTRLLSLLAVSALLWSAPASAALPRIIHLQGRLADAQLALLAGAYDMQFDVYEGASGTACHTETRTAVAVTNGLFSVRIGDPSGINAACLFAQGTAVAMSVKNAGGTFELLSPRLPPDSSTGFAAAPYALAADGLVSTGNTRKVLGNAAGNVPLSNSVLNSTLHADYLNGVSEEEIWKVGHTHRSANSSNVCECGTGATGTLCGCTQHVMFNCGGGYLSATDFPLAGGTPYNCNPHTCYDSYGNPYTCYDTCYTNGCTLLGVRYFQN